VSVTIQFDAIGAKLCETISGGRARLFAKPQPSNRRSVSLRILAVHVRQQASALSYHLQQPAATVMIVLVAPKMIGQLIDSLGQNCDLNFRRTSVLFMDPELADDYALLLFD
jgi:hypothetical protein